MSDIFTFSDLNENQARAVRNRIAKALKTAGIYTEELVTASCATWSGGLSDIPGYAVTLELIDRENVTVVLARSPRTLDACLVWNDEDSLDPVYPDEVRDVLDINGDRVLTTVKGVPTPVVDVRAAADTTTAPWKLHTTDGIVEVTVTGRGRPSALKLAHAAGIDPGTLESVSRGSDTYQILWTPKLVKMEEIED